jgi:photosystem II stability/assembly factor-like uncharacterized protein
MKRELMTFGIATILLFCFHGQTVQAHSLNMLPTSGPSAGAITFGMGFSDANPDIIYVDKYKSIDGGNSWQEMNLPEEGAVDNIAVDPHNANTVYLAVYSELHKSTDGGISWKNMGDMGTEDGTISAIAINPTNTKEIFVGYTHGKIFFSDNSGSSWNDISQRLEVISPISRIEFNPKKTQEIYISTGSWYLSSLSGSSTATGEGLFKSVNGGKTFEKLQNEFSNFLVQDVDVLGSAVYVITRTDTGGADDWDGLFKSVDSGHTWEKLIDKRSPAFSFDNINHVAIDPNDANYIIVSVSITRGDEGETVFVISRNGGTSWEEIKTDNSEPIEYTHELEITKEGKAYAQDYYRPFLKSNDKGKTWKWSSDGIRDSGIHSLEIHPTNRNLVFAGTSDGALHISYDGGKIWQRIATKLSETYISSIKFHPIDSKIFYYGVSSARDSQTGRHFGSPGFGTGLYTTKDGGKTVKKITGLEILTFRPEQEFVAKKTQLEVYDVLVHPTKPNIILVGTASEGVFRSEDGGKTWQEANNGIPKEGFYWNVNFDGPDTDELERRCKEGSEKILHSECSYYATRTSMNLFVNPHAENEIWYTTLEGVFVSHDFGKTWQWLSDDLKNIHTHFMAFDPSDKNIIYVGTHQGAIDKNGNVVDSSRGLLISRDAGKTWKQVIANGPGQGRDIRAIAINPKDINFVAVGTDEDFYVSEDKGVTWERIPLKGVAGVDEIRIDDTAKVMYLGTNTSGVWRGIIDYSSSLPAVIEITGISSPASVKPGEQFDVTVSLDNTGGKEGTLPVTLKIDDYESSKTIRLAAADQAAGVFSLSLKSSGDHEISVNDIKYGKITVAGLEEEKSKILMPESSPKGFFRTIMEKIATFFKNLFGIR